MTRGDQPNPQSSVKPVRKRSNRVSGVQGKNGRVLPPTAELVAMRQTMTLQEIADEVSRRTGVTVGRSAISADLSRNAPTTAKQPRYRNELVWTVKSQHLNEYPARQLRLLGRRRAGNPLNDEENKRLDSWLTTLAKDNLVVAYAPHLDEGAFLYVEADEVSDRPNGIPIRPRLIEPDEF